MTTLLHVDASVRAVKNDNPEHDSISKNIAKHFIDSFAKRQAIPSVLLLVTCMELHDRL